MASDSVRDMVEQWKQDGVLKERIIELKHQLKTEHMHFGIEQIPTQIELETALKASEGD